MTTKFFDRENGIVAEIEQELGVPTELAQRRCRSRAARDPARGTPARGRRSRSGSSTVYLSLIVLIPLAAVVCASRSTGGCGGVLGGGHRARRPSRRSS